jgi:uncharacterized protein YndB with AHSA1/START domain
MHSSARSIKHSSFVIERRYDFDPAQVYRAWVNPEAKARWFNGPPDKWSEQVREMDVRIGGRDRLIGKFMDGSESRFEAQYFDVVPEKRLVYTYDMYWQGKKISVSLASIEFVLAGKGTKLVVTEQHAFLDGYEDAGSRERGTRSLLENLAQSLAGGDFRQPKGLLPIPGFTWVDRASRRRRRAPPCPRARVSRPLRPSASRPRWCACRS